jgi:hypothetical protein
MADLKIDTAELTMSAARARVIASDFGSAESVAGELAAATGHDGLAAKVREFGENWDVARGRLQGGLQRISDYLTAVLDTFEDLDTDLSHAVTYTPMALPSAPAPSGPTPTPSPGPAPTAPGGGK